MIRQSAIREIMSRLLNATAVIGLLAVAGVAVSQEPAHADGSPDETAADADDRPNILLIVADDMGYTDIGSFGAEIPTPNLDALAMAGVRLANFHAAPVCAPARAMLLSGMDNHEAGIGSMNIKRDYDDVREPSQDESGYAQPGYECYLSHRVAAFANHGSLANPGVISHAYLTMQDVMPTLLELAGAEHPGDMYMHRPVHPMRGTSFLGHLRGGGGPVHDPEEVIGWELSGRRALVRGDWKLLWMPDEDGQARLNPFPIEFVDGGDTIILRIEEWNLGRTIYMPGAARPAGLASPALGYSEGRWEDGVLVVTTTDIGYPYMDDVGTPLGEAAEIIERFEMSEDGTRMDLRWTIIDPGTFTEPVELQVLHYEWRPDLQIRLYDCEPAQFER